MMRYKNFFLGGSLTPKKDYSFESQRAGVVGLKYVPRGSTSNVNEEFIDGVVLPEASRKEWDLNIGYFITPNLALSLGYKELTRDYSYQYNFSNISVANQGHVDFDWRDSSHLTAKGPIIGLSTVAPVGMGINVFANLAFGLPKVDESIASNQTLFSSSHSESSDGKYYFGELGLNYTVPLGGVLSAISFSGGYRFQRIEYKSNGGGDLNDSTHGFTLSTNASF
ncbi:putative Secreted protein [Gammaproteobacteria bacterium]